MASLNIRHGNNGTKILRQSSAQSSTQIRNNQQRSLSFTNSSSKQHQRRRFLIAATSYRSHHLETSREQQQQEESMRDKSDKSSSPSIGHDKIDEWMRESVKEIVKNLREAPLLVQVFSENNGSSSSPSTKLKTEKAIANDWPVMKEKWHSGESPSPEGVMLVEELKETETKTESVHSFSQRGFEAEADDKSKAWGIVIQGRGLGPVCYLLKTSRVNSGLGFFCTHFCLIRVHSFSQSAESLLTNCWLLQ